MLQSEADSFLVLYSPQLYGVYIRVRSTPHIIVYTLGVLGEPPNFPNDHHVYSSCHSEESRDSFNFSFNFSFIFTALLFLQDISLYLSP